jgi:hypothetical protein
MLRPLLVFTALLCAMPAPAVAQDEPLPRPADGDIHDKARRLWNAIVKGDPALAEGVFFPREPFLQIKNMQDPGRYHDKLRARFDQDIHALHKATPDLDRAVFERFELARRGGYVRVREEGNRLPYWASRHSRLHYRVGKQLRSLDVRVVIAWEGVWYVIHLSPF